MKYNNLEIQDINKFAKHLILNLVSENLENDIYKAFFGNMDIESKQTRNFLKIKGITISKIEASLLVNAIKSEIKKIEQKLSKQTGVKIL